MCYVYILQSRIDGRYYIGSTQDLKRRLRQHRSGKTRTTRVWQSTDLVYTEAFPEITDARLREKQLKSYKSHTYINWLIQNSSGPVAQR